MKRLAESIRKNLQNALKDLDFGKALQDSIGNTKIKVRVEPEFDTSTLGEKIRKTRVPKLPVEPDFDPDSIPEKVKKTRVPKVPVTLDPLLAAFQQEIRRQTSALAKQVNVHIPVEGDLAGLRAELGSQLAAIANQSKISVPTEPGGKAKYQAELSAQVAEVSARLKAHIPTEPDKGAEFAAKLRAQVDEASAKVKAKVKIEPDKAGVGAFGDAVKGLFSGLGALSLGGGNGGGGLFSGLFSNVTGTISGITSGFGDLIGSLQKVGSTGAEAGASVAGSFSSVAGPIGIAIGLGFALAASIGAATIAALALGPAIGLVSAAFAAAAGAAAALPGALTGAGAVVGTLGLGFKGIQEAFKPKTGGGGGGGGEDPASRARRIAAAERGVESARRSIAGATRGLATAERSYEDAQLRLSDAQKKVVTAQEAVNKARKQAAEDIDDLGRALRGAQLDEESAALGVTEALRALNEAKLTGNLPDIQRADLAYRQAQLTLENAKDTAQDLGDESADSAKKGVEGSDKVQSALAAQADAYKGVRDAQNGVISAQDGLLSAQDSLKSSTDGLLSAQDSLAEAQKKAGASAAAAAAKLIPLAPAAQRFVDAVKALKPAFENLRLDVQQRLFEGLDKTVTNVGKAWIPALKETLGKYADTFNGFFKNLGTAITTPTFIKDLQAGAEGARQGLSKIGDSITTSLVPAFGTLSRAAGPFLTQLGTEIANVVTDFGNWIDKADKSGALTSFFDRATTAVHDLFTTGKLVAGIIGAIVDIIIGSDASKGNKTEIEKFNGQLEVLQGYLKDPATQAKIQGFIQQVKDIAGSFLDAGNKASGLLAKFRGVRDLLFPATAAKVAAAKQDNATGTALGGTAIGDADGPKNQAFTLGQDIGAALIAGILVGIAGANDLAGSLLAELFTGPNSLYGQVKSLLGIQSPSTKMIAVGHDFVAGFVEGITNALPDLGAKAVEIKNAVTGALGDAKTWLTTHGQQAIAGIETGLSSRFAALQTTAGQVRTLVQNKLSDAGTWLRVHGQNAVTGLMNGLSGKFGDLQNRAAGMRTAVSNALSNAGTLLVNAGRNIINGLINGISNAIPSLGSVLEKVTNLIPKKKGPIEKDRVLLFGAGQAIMGGLISGISDRKSALASELADVTGLVANTSLPELGAAGDLAISKSLTAAANTKVELSWLPSMRGDKILDALRGEIGVSFRGDPMAALATG